MEIRTKFNVGDIVWCLVCKFVIGYCVVKSKITEINIGVCSKETRIDYWTGKAFIKEQDCFATKEEAQKECERRNGDN